MPAATRAQLTDPSIKTDTQSPIPSLNEISEHDYPKFDVNIPDIYRYQIWKQDFEKDGPGEPEHALALQRPHRRPAEPGPRSPTTTSPSARSSTRSRTASTGRTRPSSWSRTTARPARTTSTATARRSRSSAPGPSTATSTATYYSQINMVRTIEQILGIQPMNQKLAAATPMFDAFQSKPDLHALHRAAEPDPADRAGRTRRPPAVRTPRPRRAALRPQPSRPTVPAAEKAVAAQWEAWRRQAGLQRQQRPSRTPRAPS